jgi:preprotein translocase subunit YajC
MGPIIIIGIILAFGYVFLVRPSRRRTRSHDAMQEAIQVGDEIISAGGIHGFVKEAGEEELRVEIATDVVVTLDRRAVAAVAVTEEAAPETAEPEHQADESQSKSTPETEPGAS